MNGFQWIPVEMSQSDYDIWMHDELAKRIIRKYKEKAIEFFLWHPYARRIENNYYAKDIAFALYLLEYFKGYDEGKKVVVLADDLSYLSVLLYIHKFDVSCVIVNRSIKEKMHDFFALYNASIIECKNMDYMENLNNDCDIFIVPWKIYKGLDYTYVHRVLIYGVPLEVNIQELRESFQQEKSCVYLADDVLYEMRIYKNCCDKLKL